MGDMEDYVTVSGLIGARPLGENATALHAAAGDGNLGLCKELTKANRVAVLARDTKHGDTPMHIAIRNNHHDIVEYFCFLPYRDVRKSLFQYMNYDGDRPLNLAVKMGSASMVETIARSVDGIIDSMYDKRSPLQIAAASKNFSIMEILVKYGADVDFVTCLELSSPLQLAVGVSSPECVKFLLSHGASKDQGYGRTPLTLAAATGQLHMVQILSQDRADFRDSHGMYAIEYAMLNRDEAIIKYLLPKATRVFGYPLDCIIGLIPAIAGKDVAQHRTDYLRSACSLNLAKAEHCFEEEQYFDAMYHYSQVLVANKDSVEACFSRSQCFIFLDMIDLAEQDAQTYLDEYPGRAKAHWLMSLVLYSDHNIEGAKYHISKAETANPFEFNNSKLQIRELRGKIYEREASSGTIVYKEGTGTSDD